MSINIPENKLTVTELIEKYSIPFPEKMTDAIVIFNDGNIGKFHEPFSSRRMDYDFEYDFKTINNGCSEGIPSIYLKRKIEFPHKYGINTMMCIASVEIGLEVRSHLVEFLPKTLEEFMRDLRMHNRTLDRLCFKLGEDAQAKVYNLSLIHI